jgi:hypothetical protein
MWAWRENLVMGNSRVRYPRHDECVITPYRFGGSNLPALLKDSGRWRNPRYSAIYARPNTIYHRLRRIAARAFERP